MLDKVRTGKEEGPKWEAVTRSKDVYRLHVPGGWLYQVHTEDMQAAGAQHHIVYVPDPEYTAQAMVHVEYPEGAGSPYPQENVGRVKVDVGLLT